MQKDQDNPLSGQTLYLFSKSGSYLGNKIVSDEHGNVLFRVPAGDYKIRADYMGWQFWSDPISVSDDTSINLTLPHKDVNITLMGNYNGDLKPREGIASYLFSSGNTYIGIKKQTDSNGTTSFNLPEQSYKARFDYLGMQFWTEAFTWSDSVVSIQEGIADVRLTNIGEPLVGIKVYLFSQTGSYCNISMVTDENGIARFRVPQGTWNFRADFMGNQYWSGEKSIISHISNPVELSTGGGNFSLTVQEDALTPLANISCYLFSESDSYLNKSSATNDQGMLSFNLSDGRYKIRINYLGYQFWTPIFQIPLDSNLNFTIPHKDISLKVQTNFNGDTEPKENIKTYLFTQLASYLGEEKKTNAQGEAMFHLPEKEYKFRIDYLAQQYWSNIVNGEDTTVTIEEGVAEIVVKHGETPLENIKVHLFSESDTYLGIYKVTDASGGASFRLPQGKYKFRADHMNGQYWATQSITAHSTTTVPINTGGGIFTLSVNKSADEPLKGTSVYLFNATGSYLGVSGQSNDQGIVSFNLSDGNFKFRVDHLGYQFWSDTFLIPNTISGALTIPHQNVTISVIKAYESSSLPIVSCKTYLFSESGSYLGLSGTTDSQGQFSFKVPFKTYKVRVDYMGQQYWSPLFLWSVRQ
ncbi:YD repeat-containing protein [Candidatus Magnetoovum chiemensis]|nr:YD repeat-containing protein [Candidatus Magnetoovum chiemensis]